MSKKLDNSSLAFKVAERRRVLAEIGDSPLVLECYGGYGRLYNRVYQDVPEGVVIDKNPDKARHLARQRPGWIVLHGDCGRLLAASAVAWLPFNLLDADAWGSPWEPVLGFLASERERSSPLWIVATDGLGYKLRVNADVKILAPFVERYGSKTVRKEYKKIARELLEEGSSRAGYAVAEWRIHEQKGAGTMELLHWTAKLER